MLRELGPTSTPKKVAPRRSTSRRQGHVEVVRVLNKLGANVGLQQDGATPVLDEGHVEVVRVLR